jgi:hypothetical protein
MHPNKLLQNTPLIYNLLDFFILRLSNSSYSFFAKNEKFKAILKAYYMLNDIIVKIL